MAEPAVEWHALEAIPGRGWLYEIVVGEHAGALVLSDMPPGCYCAPDPSTMGAADRAAAEARAVELLEALLDADQLASWRRYRRFWVRLPSGDALRLGQLFDIRHRPPECAIFERSLCVVPEGMHEEDWLPEADIWINLLLQMMVDPARFFAVAVVNWTIERRAGDWTPGSLAEEVSTSLRLGQWARAVHAELRLARTLAADGRSRDALKCAVPAAWTATATGALAPADCEVVVTTALTLARTNRATPTVVDDLVSLAAQRLRGTVSHSRSAREFSARLRAVVSE